MDTVTKTKQEIEIPASVLPVGVAIAQDAARHCINYGHVSRDAEGSHVAVSTDGRRLLAAKWNGGTEGAPCEMLVGRDAWKGSAKHGFTVTDDGGDTLTVSRKSKADLAYDKPANTHFPAWHGIVPEAVAATFSIAFDPTILGELLVAIGKGLKNSADFGDKPHVVLRFTEPNRAVLIEAASNDGTAYTGVVMPCKMPD